MALPTSSEIVVTSAQSHSQQLPLWPQCQSDGSCPASASLEAACGELHDGRILERLLVESSGDPRRYFHGLQRATRPVNISQSDRMKPDFRLRAPDLASATNHVDQSKPQVSILVIGDSIGREFWEAVKEMAPWATVVFYVHTALTTLAYENDKFGPEILSAVEGLHNCSFDAVILGAFSGPWGLLRENANREKHKDPMHDAYASHRTKIAPELDRLDCLASNSHLPVVFFGAMPMDPRTQLLTSKDGHWSHYKQLELSNVWTRVEQDMERTGEWASPTLHFLHVSKLAFDCPGIRCDGLHFSASFAKDYGCAATSSVWYPLIADLLIELRLTSGVAVAHSRNRCRARQNERTKANLSLVDVCLRWPGLRRNSTNQRTAAPAPPPLPARNHVTDADQWARLQVARGVATLPAG